MGSIGYEFLRETLQLATLPVARPAKSRAVSRVTAMDNYLAVPQNVAPSSRDPIEHVTFALKHEGVNLSVLADTMPLIDPEQLTKAILAAPTSGYNRIVGFLFETVTGSTLPLELPSARGNYVDLFPQDKYVTMTSRTPNRLSSRWRVNFNGLGTVNYCATVRRTSAINTRLESDILGRTRSLMDGLSDELVERTLQWAYLSETQSSYAIERETADPGKSRSFVELLKQAQERRILTEQYLVDLQAATVSNPFIQAAAFRGEQNWLRNGLRGAVGVTYVPPPPSLVMELMTELMGFSNTATPELDPIVKASVLSFGFVFIHPFMDGNGRLSRFLFHHTLSQSGAMNKDFLLPVSVAMQKAEKRYLETLKTFSGPARELWDVRWIDGDQFEMKFTGSPSIYRYWDATECVEFGYEMADLALERDLKGEAEFLVRYDKIYREANDQFDVKGSDLSTLVIGVLDNNGIVSQNRRKTFLHRVPERLFDVLEAAARRAQTDSVPGSS